MTESEERFVFFNGFSDGFPLLGGLKQGWEGALLALQGAGFLRKPTVIYEKDGRVHARFRKNRDGTPNATPEEKERTSHILATQGARLRGIGVRSVAFGTASVAAAAFNLYQSSAFVIDRLHYGIQAAQTQTHETGMMHAFFSSFFVSLIASPWNLDIKQWQKPIVADLREWEALHPQRSGARGTPPEIPAPVQGRN